MMHLDLNECNTLHFHLQELKKPNTQYYPKHIYNQAEYIVSET